MPTASPPVDARPPSKRWLAFHIRRLRQWFGSRGISQTELANRAGIPSQRLRSLESTRALPTQVESLVRVAISLGTTVDHLIDTRHVARLRRNIETGNVEPVDCRPFCPTIAVCYRSPYLCLAVLDDGEILEVQRTRITDKNGIGRTIRKLIGEYGCRTIIVEPDRHLLKMVENLHCEVRTLSMAIAKRALVPADRPPTHAELYRHLLERFPQLTRFVTVLPSGRIAMSEKWRIVQLLPVALGLAGERLKLSQSVKAAPNS